MDPSRFRVWWNSSSLRDLFVPPYRQSVPDGLVITTTTTTTTRTRHVTRNYVQQCTEWDGL